jgi:hypothetical protein
MQRRVKEASSFQEPVKIKGAHGSPIKDLLGRRTRPNFGSPYLETNPFLEENLAAEEEREGPEEEWTWKSRGRRETKWH